MNSALPADTDEVRQYVEKFEARELRKVLYNVARQKRGNGEIRDAIKIVLLGWNWRAYNDTELSNDDLNEQIEEFIQSNRDLVDYLAGAGHTLATVDFGTSIDGQPVGKHITAGFTELLEMDAMGSTGASKAYHMLYPPVFMMWDDAIVGAYHQEGEPSHWEKHTAGDGSCYREFLIETQQFVVSELDLTRFSDKSPAKVMDEYNYAKYTLER